MPCRDDYMEPSKQEQESREAAQLIEWLAQKGGVEVRGRVNEVLSGGMKRVTSAARNTYGDREMPALLCRILHDLGEKYRQRLVYDRLASSRKARELANWWEDHLKKDRAREEQLVTINVNLSGWEYDLLKAQLEHHGYDVDNMGEAVKTALIKELGE